MGMPWTILGVILFVGAAAFAARSWTEKGSPTQCGDTEADAALLAGLLL